MDSPLDNIFDLGLVNYVRHPSNPDYVVFRFADKVRADDFEKSLKENKIWFEKGEEERPRRTYYLFGIKNRDFKKVEKINYEVEGRNRNFIIPNKFFRWTLVIVGIGILIFAVWGYCSRPDMNSKPLNTQQIVE